MSELRAEEPLREVDQDAGIPKRLGIGALAQDAAIYGGTRVLLKSLAFLLVPLYAHFLSPSAFGQLELVLATVAFVDVLVAANMDGVFARFFFDRDDPAWRRQVITLYLWIESVYPAAVVIPLILLSSQLSDRIFDTTAYASFFVIALCDLYLTNIVDLPMILCRLRRKPATFAFYSLARGVTQVAFSILLVAVWHLGVKGILIASLVSVCFAFVLTLREYVRDLVRHVDWRVGREMIAFAWPGIVGGLAFYAMNLLDRFFVKHFHGLADAGLYGVAFRYSQLVLVGVLAFRMGWTQWHYSWLDSGRHPQMVARGATYYFFGAGYLAVIVSAWILPVFHLIMPESYWDATPAVAPLALAAVATGAYTLLRGRPQRDEADAPPAAPGAHRRRDRGRPLLPAHPAVSRSSAPPGRRRPRSGPSRCSCSSSRTASTAFRGTGRERSACSGSRSGSASRRSPWTPGCRSASRSSFEPGSPPPTRSPCVSRATSRRTTWPRAVRRCVGSSGCGDDPPVLDDARPSMSAGTGSPSRERSVGATSRRSRSAPGPASTPGAGEHVEPVVGVIGVVRPGVVLEDVDGARADLADRCASTGRRSRRAGRARSRCGSS